MNIGLSGQEYSIGIHLSPTLFSLQSADNLIQKDADKFGLRFGAMITYKRTDWLGIKGGFGFALGAGGTIRHNFAGDYFPDSELDYPTGTSSDFPIPEGSNIKYSLVAFEIPLGVEFSWGKEDRQWFIDFPVFQLNIVNRARADITNMEYALMDADIGADVANIFLSWGFGVGRKVRAVNENVYTIGLSWRRSLIDLSADDAVRFRSDKQPPTVESENSSLRLRYLSVTFGVDF